LAGARIGHGGTSPWQHLVPLATENMVSLLAAFLGILICFGQLIATTCPLKDFCGDVCGVNIVWGKTYGHGKFNLLPFGERAKQEFGANQKNETYFERVTMRD
jgi:hypothetical protein